LADILAGNQSYYPDDIQKDSQTSASDLGDFIASIRRLQGRVNDPSNILGKAADDLGEYAKVFQKIVEGSEPVDHIEIPREQSPTTADTNDLYVDPYPGPYSPPNPLSPHQWKRELEVSLAFSDNAENPPRGLRPDSDPQPRATLPDVNPVNLMQPAPLPRIEAMLKTINGNPMQTLTLGQLPGGITSVNGAQAINVTTSAIVSNSGVISSMPATGGAQSYVAGGLVNAVTSTGNNSISVTSNNTGGAAHPIVQPTIICNYIMRVI
jgi:hypothetical protein